MPAKPQSGGSGKVPKVVKIKGVSSTVPRTRVPAKRSSTARMTNASYGPGPVTVYTNPKVRGGITRDAIKLVNRSVGTKIFKPTKNKAAADVVVRRSDSKLGLSTGAEGSWTKSGKGVVRTSSSLKGAFDPKGYRASLVSVRAHELGHTVGLAHPGAPRDPYALKGKKNTGLMGGDQKMNIREVRRLKALRAQAETDVTKRKAIRRLKKAKGK